MAKKQSVDENIVLIKKAIEGKKAIIGNDETIKEIKKGNVSKVFISSNCPDNVREMYDEYAGISGLEIIQLDYPNDEFATLCKKPFSISVIGLKKND